MLNRSKLLVASVAAAALLALVIGSASARDFSVDEPRFRITWEALNLSDTVFGIGVRCPITMEGSFHSSTIHKTVEALMGFVTRATLNNPACTGGNATILQETLPWHVRYRGFRGILPDIISIRTAIARPGFQIRTSGIVITCLTKPDFVFGEIEVGTREAGGAYKPEFLIPDREIAYPCGEINGRFTGNGRIRKLGTTTKILLRLI